MSNEMIEAQIEAARIVSDEYLAIRGHRPETMMELEEVYAPIGREVYDLAVDGIIVNTLGGDRPAADEAIEELRLAVRGTLAIV